MYNKVISLGRVATLHAGELRRYTAPQYTTFSFDLKADMWQSVEAGG